MGNCFKKKGRDAEQREEALGTSEAVEAAGKEKPPEMPAARPPSQPKEPHHPPAGKGEALPYPTSIRMDPANLPQDYDARHEARNDLNYPPSPTRNHANYPVPADNDAGSERRSPDPAPAAPGKAAEAGANQAPEAPKKSMVGVKRFNFDAIAVPTASQECLHPEPEAGGVKKEDRASDITQKEMPSGTVPESGPAAPQAPDPAAPPS